MPVSPSSIMHDDSLAARLFQGHDYKGSLVGDSLVDVDSISEMGKNIGQVAEDSSYDFFDALSRFFASLPWVVYAVLAVILVAFIVYWLFRSGMLHAGGLRKRETVVVDDIYEIDYDKEMQAALADSDYIELVRLVYLRTLRVLDEEGRITWRIYKTPSEYSMELGSASFVSMTNHFLRVRYGRFGADRALYDEMCDLQAEVLKGGES